MMRRRSRWRDRLVFERYVCFFCTDSDSTDEHGVKHSESSGSPACVSSPHSRASSCFLAFIRDDEDMPAAAKLVAQPASQLLLRERSGTLEVGV